MTRLFTRPSLWLASVILAANAGAMPQFASAAQDLAFSKLTPHEQMSEDILRELVAFESTEEKPHEVKNALQAMANRLLAAGFDGDDVQVLTPSENNHGLLVRYRGIGDQRPILLLAHIDVVTAVAGQWAFPPFSLNTADGFYLGRGTADNKTGVTQIISNLVRLKQEGWLPNRDVVAAIAGNEESTGDFANWLSSSAATSSATLGDVEMVLNSDAGGGEYNEQYQPRAFWAQTSEKLYQTYELTTHNRGGHSSLPREDNAIRDLALAIARLTDHQFPAILNDSTRLALRRLTRLYPEQVANDMLALIEDEGDQQAAHRLSSAHPRLNAMLRTTCVPTMLRGGHAENALPREASVIVNCRILPGTQAIEIEKEIEHLVSDLGVNIEIIWDGLASDVSNLPDALLETIETLVEEQWGEIPVIPGMSTGATDGLFFRNAGMPVYGVSGLFSKSGDSGAHGLNEKTGIREFHQAVELWYRLLKVVAE